MNLKTKQNDKTITVTGTIDGKRRQLTVPREPAFGPRRNAGRAAGQFAAKHATMAEQKRLDTAILMGEARWTDHGDGTMTFSFPDN